MTTVHSPWRSIVTHAIFSADTASLWKTISPFDALPTLVPQFIASGTTQGEGIGMTRTLHFHDGTAVQEELIAFHPETFRYVYAMTENADKPWEHYFCTVQLQALGADQTHLSATGFFQPRDGQETAIRATLAEVYEAFFAGYAHALGVTMKLQQL
ncbi:MAG: SRPBCC family protein [Chthoniobacterales bacterium]